MNVRLLKNWSWSSGIIVDDEYHINTYALSVDLLTATQDHREQNVAYDRMRHWISGVLADAVLIEAGHRLTDAFLATGQRVIEIPGGPADQLVGIMLYTKLNAIMEGRMVVTDVSISSDLGDHMVYLHSEGDACGPLAEAGWWSDPRAVFSTRRHRKSANVISIPRQPEWVDLDLLWQESDPATDANTVLYAEFPKNENK
jgi:hypothetical protein